MFTPSAILFDLDGTLADTAPDLAAALNYVREQESLLALPYETIRHVASDGARGLLQLGFDVEHTSPRFKTLREKLLAYYSEHVADQTMLFPHMDTMLQWLEEQHIPWGIVTNKPSKFTEALLKKLQLFTRTACIVSGDTLNQRKPHPAPLVHAAALLQCKPEQCCYVGDAERDIQAAKAANMYSIAALYGYIHQEVNPYLWHANAYTNTPYELLSFLKSIFVK